MLDVKVKETNPPVNAQTYPFLGIYKYNNDDKFIVLFNKKSCGTVIRINSESEFFKIGDYKTDFIDTNFVPFYGEVTLKNEV